MVCTNCGTDVPADKNFCPHCAAPTGPVATQRTVTAGGMDDVQQVELARIPAVLHAPTTWTIAKGVFLGLLLFSVASFVVSVLAFAVLLSLGQNSPDAPTF